MYCIVYVCVFSGLSLSIVSTGTAAGTGTGTVYIYMCSTVVFYSVLFCGVLNVEGPFFFHSRIEDPTPSHVTLN